MTLNFKILICLFSGLLSLSLPVTGAEKLSNWGYSKGIQSKGENPYQAFWLDGEIYRNAATDLSDLRIADSHGLFAPYFIENGSTIKSTSEVSYDSTLVKKFTKKNDTYYDFQLLPYSLNTDITGNTLQFTIPDQEFLKQLNVYGSYDGVRWHYIASDNIYSVNGQVKEFMLLGAIEKYSYYRIVILRNVENVEIDNLKVVLNQRIERWLAFERSGQLKFQIKNAAKETTITLNNPNQLKVKEIHLVTDGNFKRQFIVSGSKDQINACENSELYNLAFKDLKAAATSVSLTNPISDRLIKVKILNYDDQPLVIKNVTVSYYVDKVIFEAKGDPPYRIYFGNPKASQPAYDIEFYRTHIEKEKQDLCLLERSQQQHPIKPLAKQPDFRYWFNVVIVVISLLLVGILIKKLKFESK